MSAVAIAPPLLPAAGLMTADEFWEFSNRPENEHRKLELIRGVVVEMSRTQPPHGNAVTNLAFELTLWARTNRVVGFIATGDTGVILQPDTVVGPDVAYCSAAKMPQSWSDVAPVLAVEVQSPSDRPGKINTKIKEYLDAGTKQVWQVDPEDQTVTVYRPNQAFQIFKATDTLTGDPDLPGFTVLVGELFRLPGEPHPQPPAAP